MSHPSHDVKKLLAIDLGASSGRVILGSYDGDRLQLKEIHRFANTPVYVNGHLYWNVLALFHEMKQGIKLAFRDHGQPLSVSVDTWGVDYEFLDKQGNLLYSPHHYRDQRMNAYRGKLESLVPPEEQFELTGNQPSLINTVYQLYSDWQNNSLVRTNAGMMLMMPDLFHYLFSGVAVAEHTIMSTSGLLDPVTHEPSDEVLERLGLPHQLIPRTVPAGTIIGELLPALQQELGVGACKIIAGASHDTASAVASVPYVNKEEAAFISCGTWSLVGKETRLPILSEDAYAYGFTNEGCFGDSNRVLKNITGLWLLQECYRNWNEAGDGISYGEMVDLAREAGPAKSWVNPNDERFSTPGPMPTRVQDYCRETGQPVPESRGQIVRVIIESLARAYRDTIVQLEKLSGTEIHTIHMVGGGIQNQLLCQLTADISGKQVVAGPVEASAIGNLLVQLIALGELQPGDARALVERSSTLCVYEPAAVVH